MARWVCVRLDSVGKEEWDGDEVKNKWKGKEEWEKYSLGDGFLWGGLC